MLVLMEVELPDLERSQPGDRQARKAYIWFGTNTPLHIAANSKRVNDAIAFLSSLTNTSDVPIALLHQNSRGDTPLHCAARTGVLDLVELFISNMSNPEEKTALVRMRNRQGDTALLLAARNNHFRVVDKLIKEDVGLGSIANYSDEYPVYVAAHKGFLDITKTLVEFPATGPGRKTALHAAVSQSHEDVVKLLLEKRAELCREKDDSGSTALLYAASLGKLKIVHALLDNDHSTLQLSDENGLSALHVAASLGRVDVVNILTSKYDCSDFIDNAGRTFVHAAIVNRRKHVVKYVLNTSTLEELLNQPDDEGNTPLHLAVIQTEKGILGLLSSDDRVVIDNINRKGQTPLDIACSLLTNSPTSFRLHHIWKYLTSRGFKYSAERLDLVLAKLDNQLAQKKQAKSNISLVKNLTIISVLIATVTFAAGFTLPGGYKSDPGLEQGMATLTKALAFKLFLVSNTFSMMTSIVVIWLVLYTTLSRYNLPWNYIRASLFLVRYSLTAMVVAFPAGVYAVVPADSKWLSVLICVMAGCALLVMLMIDWTQAIFYELQLLRRARKLLTWSWRSTSSLPVINKKN